MELLDNDGPLSAAKEKVWRTPQMVLPALMTSQDRKLFSSLYTQRTWVIDPRTATWMVWWDGAMILALAFTATVTPFQIAFLTPPLVLTDGADALWIVNRISDVFFIIDVVIVCNTMYQEPLVDGGMWVSRRSSIIIRYARTGWLAVDFISCFPYFAIGLIFEATTGPGAGGGANLMPLRLVKLVRMLKLTRCLKAAAKVSPYLQEVLMGYLEFTYAKLQIALLFFYLAFFTHLQACFWALLASFTDDGVHGTWLTVYAAEHDDKYGTPPAPHEVYFASLYFSAMTVTSIGYGEFLPVNPNERLVCCLLMGLSGMVWTFVLSKMAGIASTLDPNKILFQNTMDQLNFFMRERSLPRELRRELREFFQQARRVREVNDDSALLDSMSPLLQGTVAFAANHKWLRKIWWLRDLSDTTSRGAREFVATLAKSLIVRAYVASERPPLGQIYVLRKGMAIKNWRFLRAGRVWGDDMILEDQSLMDHSQAVALTYIEVFALSKEALDASCDSFPEGRRAIDRAALRIRMQRALLTHLCAQQGKVTKSFVSQKNASGYFFVGAQISTDEKVSMVYDALIDGKMPAGRGAVRQLAPPGSMSSGAVVPLAATTTDARLDMLQASMNASIDSTDARFQRMQGSIDALALAVAGLNSTLVEPLEKMRLVAHMRRQRSALDAGRTPADRDVDAAPFSAGEKSRPGNLRRASTQGPLDHAGARPGPPPLPGAAPSSSANGTHDGGLPDGALDA